MSTNWTVDLLAWTRELAKELEFDLCGVAALDGEQKSLDAERFEAWIDAGRAGEMEYLKKRNEAGTLLRSSVQVAMPWAKSVVVCAVNYNAGGPFSIEQSKAGTGWIGRYAWSGEVSSSAKTSVASIGIASGLIATDYHKELLDRLRRLETAFRERVVCETRCYVDTGPLVERSVAASAGIGWIGKNTCVLNQKLGSWLLLGVIATSVPVATEVVLEEAMDRCGSCTRCIDACPTGALIEERKMDASRCIAYLTIEKKGVIAEEFREGIGRQVFGCDICQDVCPWNKRAPITVRNGSLARQELINPPLEWLAAMDSRDFKYWFKGSPVERTKRKGLLRNVAIAMGNSGEQRFSKQLEEWKTAEDEVLAEAARWALRRLRELSAKGAGDEPEPTC